MLQVKKTPGHARGWARSSVLGCAGSRVRRRPTVPTVSALPRRPVSTIYGPVLISGALSADSHAPRSAGGPPSPPAAPGQLVRSAGRARRSTQRPPARRRHPAGPDGGRCVWQAAAVYLAFRDCMEISTAVLLRQWQRNGDNAGKHSRALDPARRRDHRRSSLRRLSAPSRATQLLGHPARRMAHDHREGGSTPVAEGPPPHPLELTQASRGLSRRLGLGHTGSLLACTDAPGPAAPPPRTTDARGQGRSLSHQPARPPRQTRQPPTAPARDPA